VAQQGGLFDAEQELPNGLLYRADFIEPAIEDALLAYFATLPFRQARFQQYTARRRVMRFGAGKYLEEAAAEEAEFPRREFPPLLIALRARVAAWLGIAQDAFVHGLATEYRPGTPIGWHCDASNFNIVAGISLASTCTMRFRPLATRSTREAVAIELQPRSVYLMRGEIRWAWQHSILPTRALRYSVTLRTADDREPRERQG
jgi:alkylated DNA repair dioxygenase AlkB